MINDDGDTEVTFILRYPTDGWEHWCYWTEVTKNKKDK